MSVDHSMHASYAYTSYVNNPYGETYTRQPSAQYQTAPSYYYPAPSAPSTPVEQEVRVYSRVPSSASLDSPRSNPCDHQAADSLDAVVNIVDTESDKKKKKKKKKKADKNKVVESPDYFTNVPDDDDCVIEPIEDDPITAAEVAYFG